MESPLPPSSPSRVRFGVFELNVKTRELRTESQTVLLQEQPYRVLLLLLEHGSEVSTREEIKSKLWPNDTIVDFDHSINAAVKNLRRALSDSPDKPKYIETLPRLGYRLLVPVQWLQSDLLETIQGKSNQDANGGGCCFGFKAAPGEADRPTDFALSRAREAWRRRHGCSVQGRRHSSSPLCCSQVSCPKTLPETPRRWRGSGVRQRRPLL